MAERAPQASETATATAEAESPPKRLPEDEVIAQHEQDALSEFKAARDNGDPSVVLDTPLTWADEKQGVDSESSSDDAPSAEQESQPEAEATQRPEGEAEQPAAEVSAEPPSTLTTEEAESRRRQALDDQRRNLEKGFEQKLAQVRDEVRRDSAQEAENARVASMSNEERGAHERQTEVRSQLMSELRPEVQQDVVNTLTNELGPQVVSVIGLPADPSEWPTSTRDGWNERIAANDAFTFVDRLTFLHGDALDRVRTEKDVEWQAKLDKAVADQKVQFDASLSESNGATERGATSEPVIVGEGGTAIGQTELEHKYAAGTATPEERRSYEKLLMESGVFISR